jgi:hypothetical protein
LDSGPEKELKPRKLFLRMSLMFLNMMFPLGFSKASGIYFRNPLYGLPIREYNVGKSENLPKKLEI